MIPMQSSVAQSKERGLSDGGQLIVKCSNCLVELVEIWVTRAKEDSEWVVAAIKCPYCNDHSFEQKTKGGFHLGHTAKCTVVDFDYGDDGKVHIRVEKDNNG